jgi:hypothetical protein
LDESAGSWKVCWKRGSWRYSTKPSVVAGKTGELDAAIAS